MSARFAKIGAPENLQSRVTKTLGLRLIKAEDPVQQVAFPNETEMCEQLGVSRSILREAVKVLADKGMVAIWPRSGMRALPRNDWNLLDPDILCWQAEAKPDGQFLRDLCEVRLAIEPTAAGFAAVRATEPETAAMATCLERLEALSDSAPEDVAGGKLQFYEAVVAASHNPMFQELSASIRLPMQVALSHMVRLRAVRALGREAHRTLYAAILHHDPPAARAAAEEIVGVAMLAIEQVARKAGR
jgi:GntR family transcriptional regulator, galactonate operon transcriptional repressor